ncbi:MAG TPA: GGDEF domain-containing protein [Rectinemataceae bacterium]|nr:GGDEF domain-containing protein [Rectinemataceae bacterium]
MNRKTGSVKKAKREARDSSTDNVAEPPPDGRALAREAGERAIGLIEQDPEAAIALMERVENEETARGSEAGRAWNLVVRAWLDANHDQYNSAKELFAEAGTLFERLGDPYGLVKALNGTAYILKQLNLFDRGLETYRRAFEIAAAAPEADSPELTAVIGANIGIALSELGDNASAIMYLERANAQNYANPNNNAIVKATLGVAYGAVGRVDEAERMLREAIAVSTESGFRVTEAESLGRLGILLARAGRLVEAVLRLREACAMCRALRLPRLEAEFLLELGRILRRMGRSRAAQRNMRRAARIARGSGDESVLSGALIGLAETHARDRDWKSAYILAREARRLEAKVAAERVSTQASVIKAERAEAEAAAYRDHFKRLSTISEIGRAVAAATDVDAVSRILYQKIASLMDAGVFGVALYHEESDQLEYRYFVDEGEEMEPFSLKVNAETSLSGWCVRNGREIVLGDAASEYRAFITARTIAGKPSGQPIKSIIYYPVMVKNKPLAVVTVQSRKERAYQPHHVETLKALGAYMGVALENARLFEELRLKAVSDPLTGAINRRRFMELLSAELDRSRRYRDPVSAIMLDIDHFKDINDGFGHAAGDDALRAIVQVCATALRGHDILSRYGGEEFACILPSTDLEGGRVLAERLRSDIERCRPLPSHPSASITASIGVAEAQPGEGPEALIMRADQALYAAKRGGRNRVEVDDVKGEGPARRPETKA